jgi:hypothetical protein
VHGGGTGKQRDEKHERDPRIPSIGARCRGQHGAHSTSNVFAVQEVDARNLRRLEEFTRAFLERYRAATALDDPSSRDPRRTSMDTRHIHLARMRIQIEYIEMPQLKLTLAQVRRLCDLPQEVCEAAMASLVSGGFLLRTREGSFLRPGIGHSVDAITGPRALAAIQ